MDYIDLSKAYERLGATTGLFSGQSATVEQWAIRLNCKPEDIWTAIVIRSQGLLYFR